MACFMPRNWLSSTSLRSMSLSCSKVWRAAGQIIERFGGATTASEARHAAREQPAGAPRRVVRHNVTNVRFESVSPEEAVVSSYFTVFTEVGADHMGRYRDRLVPVGERWLIAHRFVSTDWHAANSIFGTTGRL